jgi:D-threo-aldose 1-dehydrogenase
MYNYAPATHEILKRVARIDQVCRAFDVPLAAVALQFPLGHPAVASVIPGAVSPEQIEASVRYLRTPIPDELWKALKSKGLIVDEATTPNLAPNRIIVVEDNADKEPGRGAALP